MPASSAKYWVLSGLTILAAVIAYILGAPQISESVVLGAVLIAVTAAIKDLEDQPTTPGGGP